MSLKDQMMNAVHVGVFPFQIVNGDVEYLLIKRMRGSAQVWDIPRGVFESSSRPLRSMMSASVLFETALRGQTFIDVMAKVSAVPDEGLVELGLVEVNATDGFRGGDGILGFGIYSYDETCRRLGSNLGSALDGMDAKLRSLCVDRGPILRRDTRPEPLLHMMKEVIRRYAPLWPYFVHGHQTMPRIIPVKPEHQDMMRDVMSGIAVTTALHRYFQQTFFMLDRGNLVAAPYDDALDHRAWILQMLGKGWPELAEETERLHPSAVGELNYLIKLACLNGGFARRDVDPYMLANIRTFMSDFPHRLAFEMEKRVLIAYDGKCAIATRALACRDTVSYRQFCSMVTYLNLPVFRPHEEWCGV